MAYTLKNGSGTILNGKTVRACVLVDGSSIVDLAGNTLSVGAGLATGSTAWLSGGPSIPWFRAVNGSGDFDPRLVEWSTYPTAEAPSQITVYVLSLGRPDNGAGTGGHRGMVAISNAGASAGVQFIAHDGTTDRMIIHTGSTSTAQRSDSIPSSPVMYKYRWVPFGSCVLGQVQGGGSAPSAFDTQTPSDGGFGTGDNLRLRSIGGTPGNGRCSHNIALVLVLGGGSTLSGAEETTFLADPIGAVAESGGPVLSSPSGSVTSNTAATITASTDTLSDGTMHFLRRTGGSAASAATIISTGESQATSGSNPQSKSVTLLGSTANQYVDIAQDGTAGDSNVVTVGPLTTATTLSAPTGTATGNTTATVGFTTDRAASAAFPAYFLTLPAGDSAPADAATLIANGSTVSQTTGGTTPTRALTGLTTATAYRTHFCQPGSNVVSSSSYTPSTMTYSGTIGPQGGVQGAAHVWSGASPSTLFSGGIGTKSYSGTGLGASGLTVNATTGQLQGTYGTPGTYNVAIVGTDQSTAGSEIPQTETSNTFTLTITATGSPPTVATNPSNLTVTDGATASFTASFNGSPIPSLQWQEFIGGVWTAMSGQTGNVLALGTVALVDSGRSFRLGGTNVNGGPVYTASATLTVTPAAVGTITSEVFAGWGDDTPIASTTINFVKVERVSTGAIVLELTSQVTGTDGRLIITNAAITPGVEYMLWCRNTAGTIRGGKKYTAT